MQLHGNVFDFTVILKSILSLIFLFTTIILLIGTGDNQLFLSSLSIGNIEIFSLIIFIVTLFIGSINIKWYAFFLIFNVLALPSSVDNLMPSVLISAPLDIKEIYFPIITHIDIFLLYGLIRYSILKESIIPKKLLIIVGIGVVLILFATLILQLISVEQVYDFGLIISHSYHLRYLILFMLLFAQTEIYKHKIQFVYGLLASFIFLLAESFSYSFIFNDKNRLISGTLGYNVYANVLASIFIYYVFLLIRKKINSKLVIAVPFILLAIILTKTRSALFVVIIYALIEAIRFLVVMVKRKQWNKFMITTLVLVFFGIIISFGILKNERLNVLNFKIESIDLTQKELVKLIKLDDNAFNASLKLRLEHYQTSLNMIYENPIIGLGPGRWNRYKADFGSVDTNIMDSHNDILALTSQYGIFQGLLLFVFIYLCPLFIYKTFKAKSLVKHQAIHYLFIINISMAILSLTNANLFKHQIYAFLLLLLMTYIFKTKQLNDSFNVKCHN